MPVLGLPEPELLLEHLVFEVFVVGEAELEREAARLLVDLKASDLERLEALGEDLGVGGLDEVLNLLWALLED